MRCLTKMDSRALSTFVKVALVRPPLSRLSATYAYGDLVESGIVRKLPAAVVHPEGPGFDRFVARVAQTTTPETMDLHLRPQSILCRTDAIAYDALLRFEALEEDLERLLRQLGKHNAIDRLHAA